MHAARIAQANKAALAVSCTYCRSPAGTFCAPAVYGEIQKPVRGFLHESRKRKGSMNERNTKNKRL